MRRINPKFWVSLRPNGIGLNKPFHHFDMAKIAWANRRHGRYAWKVLTQGVCDGCALGVAGLHDWTMDDIHLCLTRLRLLEMNCADPIKESAFKDVATLRLKSGKELRDLGGVQPPREFVLMDRAAVGLGSVFLHLKAQVNWHRAFHGLIEGFSVEALAARARTSVRRNRAW